jgi:asparagine synthase (glutamine-hydrolysing)
MKQLKYIAMCGIVCAFDLKQKVDVLRPQVLEMSKLSVTADQTGAVFTVMIKRLCLMRLAIVDPASVSNLYLVKMEN